MTNQYLAVTIAAAFWRGEFQPVDVPGAARLGFQIGHDDVALGWADWEAGVWALLLLGRGHILAITPDGTALEVSLDGVLLGERRHRVVASVTADDAALSLEAAE